MAGKALLPDDLDLDATRAQPGAASSVILGLAERLERRHMHIARSAMADHGAAAKNWAAASMRCMGDRGGASTNSMRELFEKRRDRALLMAPKATE